MFMGTGTTAIASLKNNCDYIGFELSDKYCDIARKRIEEHMSQVSLFDGALRRERFEEQSWEFE